MNTVIKSDFPLLANTHLSYLDNAATTQKPISVIEAMNAYYRTSNANVHRGLYALSEQATAQYEAVRDQTQAFIQAAAREEIIFTAGTTAAINTIAYSLGELMLKPGDVILVSQWEHHSNLVPWQLVAKRYQATVEAFDGQQIEAALHDRVKIVAVAHITNSAGMVLPIQHIIQAAHAKQIPVVVDAAQSAPHLPINVQALDCDFLVWSAHKMCGPTGVGVLYGKRSWLERMQPVFGGGDMIREVTLEQSTWNELPYKFEAGTPNIAGVIGWGAAMQYLQKLGWSQIHDQTQLVYAAAYEQLSALPYVTIFAPTDPLLRSNIISFNIAGVHAHDAAAILDQHGVAIRAGHHCAQPVMAYWGVPATARASFYVYNTLEDVSRLVVGVQAAYDKFK